MNSTSRWAEREGDWRGGAEREGDWRGGAEREEDWRGGAQREEGRGREGGRLEGRGKEGGRVDMVTPLTPTSGDIANVIHINSRSHNDPQSMFILITIQVPGASILNKNSQVVIVTGNGH